MERKTRSRIEGRTVVGIGLLLIGALLILDNYGLVDVGPVWDFWPLIVVLPGLVKIVQAQTMEERRHGAWLLFVGLWLSVSFFHLFGLSFRTSWPILIIGWGTSLVLRSLMHETAYTHTQEHEHGH
jgi:hypothetical protein